MKRKHISIVIAIILFAPLSIMSGCSIGNETSPLSTISAGSSGNETSPSSIVNVGSNGNVLSPGEIWNNAFGALAKADANYQITEYYLLSDTYRNHLLSYLDGYYTKYYIDGNKYMYEYFSKGNKTETDYYELDGTLFAYIKKYDTENYFKRKKFYPYELPAMGEFLLDSELDFLKDTMGCLDYFNYHDGQYILKQDKVAFYYQEVYSSSRYNDNYAVTINVSDGKISEYKEEYEITYMDGVKASVSHVILLEYGGYNITLPHGNEIILAQDLAIPKVDIVYNPTFELEYLVWDTAFYADTYGLYFSIEGKIVYSFGMSYSGYQSQCSVMLDSINSSLRGLFLGRNCIVRIAAISWKPMYSDSVSEGFSFVVS